MTNDPVFVTTDDHPPKVVGWFKVYAGFLAFIYFVCAGLSLIFFLVDPVDLEMDVAVAQLTGALLLVVGVGLFIVCFLPLVLNPRPWMWTYDLIVICLGMTSACFWPACIPLLIFWVKPETKSYFGKK